LTGRTARGRPPGLRSRHLPPWFWCSLAALCLVGCTSARSSLGTSDSGCFVVLPTAVSAVSSTGPRATLLGVRSVSLATLHRQDPALSGAIRPDRPGGEQVCLVAFRGAFRATSVAKPYGLDSGPVAVAVVQVSPERLLGTYIADRVPLKFGHSHIG
jgi:hypothetical protein